MNQQISDAPLVVRDPDPAAIELEVMRLREQCRSLLVELERRYEHLRALPSRIKARVRQAPRALASALGRHKVIAFAVVGAAAAGLALALWQRRRKRRAWLW